MATRAERMQQRIRGTGHGQVQGDDVSFHIDLGGEDDTTTDEGSPSSNAKTPTAEPAKASKRSTPTSAPEPEETNTAIRRNDAAAEPIPSSPRPDPDSVLETAEDVATPVPARMSRASASGLGEEEEDLIQLSAAARDALGSARSMLSQRTVMIEEVAESPVKAPGTGQRRSVRSSNASSASARLQQAMSSVNLEDADPLSSPSEQRTSRIRLSQSRPQDSPRPPEAEEPDELSPEQTMRRSRFQKQASPDLSSPHKLATPTPPPEEAPTPVLDEEVIPEPLEASPIEDVKKRRGRKPRSVVEAETTKEASVATETPTEEAPVQQDDAPPAGKQRRGRKRRSPVAEVEEPFEASVDKEPMEEEAEASPAPVEQGETEGAKTRRGRMRQNPVPAKQGPAGAVQETVEAPAPAAQDKESSGATKRRGRRRRSPVAPIEEPVAATPITEEPTEEQDEEPTASVEPDEDLAEPARRRRRKPEKTSPAKQKQGRRKQAKELSASQEAAPKAAKKRRAKRPAGEEANDLVVFTQRYAKRRRVSEGDSREFNILTVDIPHANRPGVNCIDVLSSMFSEVIDATVSRLEDTRTQASDAAAKNEVKVKMRALEAFQAELRLHFLEHTINVDHAHALRQRIKQEKREKTDLRDEILRLRAEREHIAIRKDAIRAKHEKRREETKGQLDLSSALHDVELAIERGRSAPDLSPAQEKQADLANLELLVARLSEQGSTRSDTGGTLRQLKEFNAFLERAAAAMEAR